MEVEHSPAPSVAERFKKKKEKKVAPYSHLFATDSSDAASRAPKDVTDEMFPRHPDMPEYRQLSNGQFVYMEEGEISFPEHPYPALRAALEGRGIEVREKLAALTSRLQPCDDPFELYFYSSRILVHQNDVMLEEIPLELWRSTIVKEFLESQSPEFLQLLPG